MPPLTPSSRRATGPAFLTAVPVLDLAARDLFQGDGQVVLRAGVHHRRRELLERALAEVVVVRVDLARALGGHGHAGVWGVHVLQQAVGAGGDQEAPAVRFEASDASAERTTSSSAATASSSRSL